jgi:hypothetical protein
MTQPPLGVNQSVVELTKRTPAWGGEEQEEAQETKNDKLEFRKKGKKEEVLLPTLSNRQDQYTFISPVTPDIGLWIARLVKAVGDCSYCCLSAVSLLRSSCCFFLTLDRQATSEVYELELNRE